MKKNIYNKDDGVLKNALKFFKVNFIYNLGILISCIIIGSINNNIIKAIYT